MSNIEAAFARELEQTYHQAVAQGYRATYFLKMLGEFGAVETAHRLLASEDVSEGLMRLWERQLLDISVEAIVLKPEYAPLFSNAERAIARQRLAALDHAAPWDRGAH